MIFLKIQKTVFYNFQTKALSFLFETWYNNGKSCNTHVTGKTTNKSTGRQREMQK